MGCEQIQHGLQVAAIDAERIRHRSRGLAWLLSRPGHTSLAILQSLLMLSGVKRGYIGGVLII